MARLRCHTRDAHSPRKPLRCGHIRTLFAAHGPVSVAVVFMTEKSGQYGGSVSGCGSSAPRPRAGPGPLRHIFGSAVLCESVRFSHGVRSRWTGAAHREQVTLNGPLAAAVTVLLQETIFWVLFGLSMLTP